MKTHYDNIEELWEFWITRLPDEPQKQIRDQIVVVFIVMVIMIGLVGLVGFQKEIMNRGVVAFILYVLQALLLYILWHPLSKLRGKRKIRRLHLVVLQYMGCLSSFFLFLAVGFLLPSLTVYTVSTNLITQITTLAVLAIFFTVYIIAFAFSPRWVSKYFISENHIDEQQNLTRAVAIRSAMISGGILIGTIFGRGTNQIGMTVFIGLAFIVALILLPFNAILLSQMVLLIRLSLFAGSEEQS